MATLRDIFKYHRWSVDVVRYFIRVLTDLIFAGEFFYRVYEYFFPFTIPQRQSNCEIRDWENPKVVGRNRRFMHSPLKSFVSVQQGLDYWKYKSMKFPPSETKSNKLNNLTPNLISLTGKSFSQWKFTLVGNPMSSPAKWNKYDFDDTFWSPISLPSHWQLQGYDIPLYTNTTYPFKFDPPRVSRDGTWSITSSDKALGVVESSGLLSPLEPGDNTTGLYRLRFAFPASWLSKNKLSKSTDRYFLQFDGVDSCVSVWLNDVFVGYSQDSSLPAEFDISTLLHCDGKKDNVLAVQVARWCDGSYLEDHNEWWLSGIYRNISLLRKPQMFIGDVEFSCDVSSKVSVEEEEAARVRESAELGSGSGNKRQTAEESTSAREPLEFGSITINVMVEGVDYLESATPPAVRVDLYALSSDGEVLGSPCFTGCAAPLQNSRFPLQLLAQNFADCSISDHCKAEDETSIGIATVMGRIFEPLIWSAELPQMYALSVSLFKSMQHASDGTHEPLDVEVCRVGLRDCKVFGKDNQLCVNEVPICIAGVNRTEFDPVNGRSLSEETMFRDICLLKQLNFNAVRCGPTCSRWLEMCDEAGIYVIEGANINSHGFQFLHQPIGYLANQDDWRGALLSRLSRMVERDKNYSCIIGWSLGTESGLGSTHEESYSWVRTRDPTRFVQYESGGALSSVTDIICPASKDLQWCLLQEQDDDNKRPVILSEYADTIGNSGGSLSAFWRLFRSPKYPRLQGGFIANWIDQGLQLDVCAGNSISRVQRKFHNAVMNRPKYGYGGDFGDFPNSKQFCLNGILAPDRSPHPIALETAQLQAPISCELVTATPAKSSETNDANDTKSATKDDAKDSEVLCFAVFNRRSHADMSDILISVRLCCDSQEITSVQKTKKLTRQSLPPESIYVVALRDIWPQLSDGLFTPKPGIVEEEPGSSPREDSLSSLFGLTEEKLLLATEFWLDIVISTSLSTPFVPTNHVISHRSISHPMLNTLIKKSLEARILTQTPMKGMNEYDVNFQVLGSSGKEIIQDYTKAAKGEIVIGWSNGMVATVGLECGRLISWKANGMSLISDPLDICLTRAPTDNDRSGGDWSYFNQWEAAGLYCLKRKIEPGYCNAIDLLEVTPQKHVLVEASWILSPHEDGKPLPAEVKYPREIRCRIRYLFCRNGSVGVTSLVEYPSSMPSLPRFGFSLAMPSTVFASSKLNSKSAGSNNDAVVTWLGIGPHESYCDRKSSCRLGYFECTVSDLRTPYVCPQESGSRAEPRWIAVRKAPQGPGMMIIPVRDSSAVDGWSWNVSLHSVAETLSVKHDHELIDLLERSNNSKNIYVHIDSAMMGVGEKDNSSQSKHLTTPPMSSLFGMWDLGMSSIGLDHFFSKQTRGVSTRVLLYPINKQQSCSDVYMHVFNNLNEDI